MAATARPILPADPRETDHAHLASLGRQPGTGLLMIDPRHQVQSCSEGFCAVHGGCAGSNQIVGLPYHAVLVLLAKSVGIAGADAVQAITQWPNTVYRRYLDGDETPFLTRLADGRWLEIEQASMDDATAVFWRDTTSQMQALLCLSDAIQAAPEALSLWDQAGRLVRSNAAFSQMMMETGVHCPPRIALGAFLDEMMQKLPLTDAAQMALFTVAANLGAMPPKPHFLSMTDGRVLIAMGQRLSSGGHSLSLRWATENRSDQLADAQASQPAPSDQVMIEWPVKPVRKRLLGDGLLLGDAVDAATAQGNGKGGNLNDAPVGKDRLQNGPGGVILWHGESRHH